MTWHEPGDAPHHFHLDDDYGDTVADIFPDRRPENDETLCWRAVIFQPLGRPDREAWITRLSDAKVWVEESLP